MQCWLRGRRPWAFIVGFRLWSLHAQISQNSLKPLIILWAVYINVNEISNKNTNLADQVYTLKCIEKNCKSRGKLKFNVFSRTCVNTFKRWTDLATLTTIGRPFQNIGVPSESLLVDVGTTKRALPEDQRLCSDSQWAKRSITCIWGLDLSLL